jgi:hypothetical protein
LSVANSFEDFTQVNLERKKAAAPRSRIEDYTSSSAELSLQQALHTFRRNVTIERFGYATLSDMGPGVIMSDAILKCIIDCAHKYKIDCLLSLARETWWLNTQSDGLEVISLINIHCPKRTPTPFLVSMPLHSMQAATPFMLQNPSSSTLTKSTCKCGKCGSASHIG